MPRPPPRSTLFPYTTLFRSTGALAPSFNTLERVAMSDPRLHDEQTERRMMEDFGPFFRRGLEALRGNRSEEHTSELQSQSNLVCRLLLEKKKKKKLKSHCGV